MENKLLNIVDEEGNIIGKEARERIHEEGLLHKEIHVWFYTPNKEIIFQHRAKNKETFPNLLDATVGGHVEIGDDYMDAAVKEIKDETGISIKPTDLTFVKVLRNKAFDPVTKKTNNVLRAVYVYPYSGEIEDLKVEEGESLGFEPWSIDKILTLGAEEKKKFIPTILNEDNLKIFQEI